MPVQIVIGGCWFLGDLMCSLYWLINFIITSASVGNMVLISVDLDRYVAICDPLCYPTKITWRRVKICVCLCWICSVLYSSLVLSDTLMQPGRSKSCQGECVVVINSITGAVDFILNFNIPITVIIVLYMRVFVVAVSQARAMRSHIVSVTLQHSGTGTAKKSELKAARTLGVVVVVFLLCLCPYYCVSFAGQDAKISFSSGVIVLFLYFLNSCLNPIIYALFYPWFRKAIKLIFTLQILQPDSCDSNVL
uniref:G-protein coupled receptors family 1 profile domain-containing protein n=1 Tax=Myripristis murdjan TaxID=586833 RepID=A0A667WMK7_9TELE